MKLNSLRLELSNMHVNYYYRKHTASVAVDLCLLQTTYQLFFSERWIEGALSHLLAPKKTSAL